LARTARLTAALVVALLLVAAVLVWRFGWGPAPASAPARVGGQLVATIRSEPRTFNRYIGRDAASETVSLLTQAKLVRVNRTTGEIEPWLADSWTLAPDGVSYTVKLRPGVTFSDGVPFTSADVVFAFEALYDDTVASPVADSVTVGGKRLEVSAPDATTVVIRFPSPFGPGLRLLDNVPILPKYKLEAALRAGTFASAWGPTTPPSEMSGLGPFVLEEYQAGQRLVFERNPHYWRRDPDGVTLPYLDRLILEIVPDQNAELLRLQAGETDLTQSEVRPEDYATLKRQAEAGRLRLEDVGIGLDLDSLWFNLKPAAKARDPRRAWLQSGELRHAISEAVDRRAFAESVFLGAAVPSYGAVSPGNTRWYATDVPADPYDPGAARTLLAGLGLVDGNGDGMLEDRSGAPVRFTLLTMKGNSPLERGAAFLREELRKVGISVDVVPLETGAVVQRIEGGDYDAVYFRFQASDTDPAVNLDLWLTSGAFHVWNPSQMAPATEWERRVDDLMRQQVSSLDEGQRKWLFAEVQRVLAEHRPLLTFAAPRFLVAISSRVAHATPAPMRPPVLWNPDILAVRR